MMSIGMVSQLGKSNGINSKLVTPKRKLEILQKREEVASLLGQGLTIKEIADRVGIYWSGVYKIIEKMSISHQRKIQNGYDRYLLEVQAGYNKVLSESWTAYESSKKDQKGEARQPNVLYLDRILATYEALRKLHGLDKTVPKDESNTKGAQGLDWDSLTARKSLSSVTVNINGQTPNHPVDSNSSLVRTVDSVSVSNDKKVEELKDAVEQRIEELHRRAEEKTQREAQESTSSSQDVPTAKQEGRVVVTHATPLPTKKKIIKVKKPIPVRRTIIMQDASPLGE